MKKDKIILFYIFIFFGFIYCAISLVNHYEFRTYALDLGMFNQAIYSFAHLHLNFFTLAPDGHNVNYFADHFSLLTVLFSPFYYLAGSYTLLIIQIASILFGGCGTYLFARHQLDSKYLPLLVLLQFFGIWGIYSALAFDFHNNVVAAMLVPWMIYSYVKDKKQLFVLFFLLILIAKENMALWLIFILLGLMIRGGLSSWRKYFIFEVPLAITAGLYFVIVVGIIMPALNNGEVNQINRYEGLGRSPSAIGQNLAFHPQRVLSMMFNSQLANSAYSSVKYELHTMVMLSGGMALILAPSYWIMLVPIYLQKFLTNDPALWGITGQYSIEFVPIISLALTATLFKLKRRKLQYTAAIFITALTYASLCYVFDAGRLTSFNNSDNTDFYSVDHYKTKMNIPQIYENLNLIPDDAPLSVSSSLAPHLSFRDKVYLYPVIKDAEYVALLRDKQDNFVDLKQLPEGKDFVLISSGPNLVIYRKNTQRLEAVGG